jgi:hypothetical protein
METMLNHSPTRNHVGGDKPRDVGAAMVIAAIVATIAMALGGVMLSQANRENSSSNNDRMRQHAIDAAMAGAVVAASALANDPTYAGTDPQDPMTVADGDAQFEITVVPDPEAPTSFRRVVTAIGYAPSKAAPVASRSVRQLVELDPIEFEYGLFTDGSYSDGSSGSVTGSLYAGGSITLGNAHDYVGNLSAIGSISTGSNQTITGTLHANGSVSVSNTSTVVNGSVFAGGSITTGGIVRDVAQAGGTVSNCAKVQGSCIQHSPPPPVQVQHLPQFVYNPANYSPPPVNVTGSDFVTRVKNQTYTQGVYNVSGSVSFKNNETMRLTGNMTIITSGSLTLPGTITGPAGQTVQLALIIGGSMTAPNNLTIPSTVRTLLYTNGSFSAANRLIFTGVLYTHGSFTMGANSSITYAPVDSPGFDWTQANPQSFSVRNIATREITGA